ncbi:ABC transporter permease [uncultured Corynebacterium sp.]|uniref:ABC transporter permease n=1 Tax=uncultured Corynebacterium sp. TaxID=159447 RepID=UPI0025FF3DEF|nr:ABC transporter permease [uncultured Corynebacterium sp.]
MIAVRSAVIVAMTVAVSFVMFALAAASPFDPLASYLGTGYARLSEAERADVAAAIGADVPWWRHWLDWMAGLVTGDPGYSRSFGLPVADVLAERLPWTILLSVTGLTVAVVAAILLGTWAGHRPGGRVDRAIVAMGVFLAATPPFLPALVVVMLFALTWHVIPAGGAAPIGEQPTLATVGPYLVGPAAVLAITQLPWPLLAVRRATAEAVGSDAVEHARARGLSPGVVLRRHVAPMSLMPLVTIVGGRLSELVVGTVIVETVFSWPGLADAAVTAAVDVDFPLLAATTVLTTVLVMGGNLVADVTYTVLDPRVRDV